MSWLTNEEAIRSAFEYRWRGQKSQDPILLTDFNWENPRVVEVLPGDWNDVTTWTALERKLTVDEWSAINAYVAKTHGHMALGNEVMQEHGYPVRVRGYIKRDYNEGTGWHATLDLDAVRGQIDADSGSGHT